MMKNRILSLSAVLLTLTLQAAERPNLLFFLVDDMGILDTSVPFLFEDGQPVVTPLNRTFRTPNMERLADQGKRFTRAYAYSVCSPTRVSLLTGQAAPRHRVTTWTHPASYRNDTGRVQTDRLTGPEWNTRGVPPQTPLLPQALKQAGYTTLFAGKAHFGPDDTTNGDPLKLGFDVNIAGYGGGGPGSYYGEKNYSASWRGGGHQWDVPGLEAYHGTPTFLTEALTLEMSKAMEQAVETRKPFFAYMSHYAVHAPFEADPRFTGNYPGLSGHGLAFATLVEGMDRSLGDLIRTLENLGVAEETLIVFYSDNGSDSPLGSSPLRGKKGTRFEGGLRVPLIMAWAKPDPDHPLQKEFPILGNSRENDLVTCLDLMPTFLELGGATVPPGTVLDGRSLTPYLQEKEEDLSPRSFLCHFPHGRHNNTLFTTYQRGDWKVIYQYAGRTWELYHLTEDPGETRNRVEDDPEKALELAGAMMQELELQQAQFPLDRETGRPVPPDLSLLREE